MKQKYDLFISYSRRNQIFVNRLVADLREHQLRVWLDTLEVKVGEQFRRSIEAGIEQSRFFCFIISDASLKSYVARRVELESAFARMERDHKRNFILPIRWQCTKKLPLELSTYHHLNFAQSKSYSSNLNNLIERISPKKAKFTGEQLFKNIDATVRGILIGVGHPLKQPTARGSCMRVFFDNGRIKTMETYTDGKRDGAKSVIYDDKGRVSEIVLFRNNKVIDTWRYEYDKRGLRKYKWVCPPGQPPNMRLSYDAKGTKTSEAFVAEGGNLKIGPDGWSEKRYVRSAEGDITGYLYLDQKQKIIRTESI